MIAIGEVQHPEQRQLAATTALTADAAVQAAAAQLRLTFRLQILKTTIAFEDGDYGLAQREGSGEALRADKIQIIR